MNLNKIYISAPEDYTEPLKYNFITFVTFCIIMNMKTLRITDFTWDRMKKFGDASDTQESLMIKILGKAEK